MAILFAIATYVPNYIIVLFIFGRVKLKYLALIIVLVDILSIPLGNAGGHIAHLGGAFWGFLYIILLKQGSNLSFRLKKINFGHLKFKKRKTTYENTYQTGRPLSDEEFNTLRTYIQIFKEKDVLEKSEKTIPAKILNPFPFDPNLIDSTEMERLGLKDGQIRNIINYISKGGKFKVKSDFGKLYSISEDDFSVLEKYILLPSVEASTSIQISEEKTPIIVDLNAADTIELKQLKGIGTVFARRIVSYREKLGGYFDKSQLLEVFGMDTARLAQISPYIEVDLQKIKQLHLNKAGYKELLAHPYLENYIVKAIFEYKDKVGKFNSVDELQNISLIYPQLFQKIEHYFTVEDSYTRR